MTTQTAKTIPDFTAAYDAGHEDGVAWIQERQQENALRAEQGDAPLKITVPETGWDEATINGAGRDVFARLCGLTAAQVEERGEAWEGACDAYNRGAVDAVNERL